MSSQIMVRIDDDLKNQAARLARAEGKSLSELVRTLLEQYSRERDMAAYTDDLWRRIGERIDISAKDPSNLDAVIRDVRTVARREHR